MITKQTRLRKKPAIKNAIRPNPSHITMEKIELMRDHRCRHLAPL